MDEPKARVLQLQKAIEAVAEIDRRFLDDHRKKTGAPYEKVHEVARKLSMAMPDGEVWQDIPAIAACGSASHVDLACWRIAELRSAGIDASPSIVQDRGIFLIQIRIDDEDGGIRYENVPRVGR